MTSAIIFDSLAQGEALLRELRALGLREETAMPSKTAILGQIIQTLEADLALLLQAARTAHAAATHEENIPDNKYATLALEASYLAQAQANRAQDIRQALAAYRRLDLPAKAPASVRLATLVTLEDEAGEVRTLFLGPEAGGMKLRVEGAEVLVITPGSPLGRALLGQEVGEVVSGGAGEESGREYEILAIV